jgi:murein DD-endopeptidase MepM/ murein hydrolase activator NlpD
VGLLLVTLAAVALNAPAPARADSGPLTLGWPANGTITSGYGHDGGRWHAGVDIGILRSPAVRAAAAGVVTKVGYIAGYEGYGNVVELSHGRGYSTLYAHLSRSLVPSGAEVAAGELIGVAGCTGWCTGTHLHFELRVRGRPVDPFSSGARLHWPVPRAVSSVGRAPARQAGGHWFEPSTAHSGKALLAGLSLLGIDEEGASRPPHVSRMSARVAR